MIQLDRHRRGVVIGVRAQPGARRAGIQGEHGGMLKVAVAAPPDRGRANDAIVDLLAKALGLARSQIELVGGASSRHKRFLVAGIDAEDLAARIERAIKP